ncbi:MAG: hypothetical protein COB12_12440 [Flavobacterium sp.]|nr:MAG: hypothetical protein COB12_12440 [Flavobacterium sp.]
MGRIFRRSEQPVEAAKWYAEIPNTASKYSTAQLEAGQALWTAYLTTAFKENVSETKEQLQSWQDQAAKHLETGITATEKATPATAPAPAELIRAKVSLAQIEIMRGNDAKAIQWLAAEPHSVVKAVAVEEGKARPKENFNIQSTAFASLSYQHLLRAYIGTRQLDKAEEARAALEKIAGASGGASLTAVYVELGRELQSELERLRKAGDQERLEKVRGGFEQFLSKLLERQGGQTYGSLIWIAETYFGMAQASEESPQKAKQYYADATKAFEEILKQGEKDPKFVDAARLDGVRLRLVNCKRQEGDFETAESLIKTVLLKNSKALDAQIEAAQVYQDWGEFGDEPDRFLDAIKGKKFKDGTVIWGWGNISMRLQMSANAGQTRSEYKEKHREAQYHLAQSRFLYAKNTMDLKKSEQQLQRAKQELLTYTRLTTGLTETPWWDKFDTLYQDILSQLGEIPVSLTKPEPLDQVKAKKKTRSMYDTGAQANEANQKPTKKKKSSDKTKPASNMMTYIMMGVMLVAGIGFFGFMMKSSGGKRSTAESITESSSFSEESLSSSKRPSSRRKSTSKEPRDPEKKPSQSSSQKRRPRTEKPAEETTKKRVRKKRPPTEE